MAAAAATGGGGGGRGCGDCSSSCRWQRGELRPRRWRWRSRLRPGDGCGGHGRGGHGFCGLCGGGGDLGGGCGIGGGCCNHMHAMLAAMPIHANLWDWDHLHSQSQSQSGISDFAGDSVRRGAIGCTRGSSMALAENAPRQEHPCRRRSQKPGVRGSRARDGAAILGKFGGRGGVRRRAGMHSRGACGLRGVGGHACHWPHEVREKRVGVEYHYTPTHSPLSTVRMNVPVTCEMELAAGVDRTHTLLATSAETLNSMPHRRGFPPPHAPRTPGSCSPLTAARLRSGCQLLCWHVRSTCPRPSFADGRHRFAAGRRGHRGRAAANFAARGGRANDALHGARGLA